jgi:hypothetical protein
MAAIGFKSGKREKEMLATFFPHLPFFIFKPRHVESKCRGNMTLQTLDMNEKWF